MKSDIEISNECKKKKIIEIAKKLNLRENQLELYGNYKAKINLSEIKEKRKGKLILVTATNPTPFGEGKTTISIGLGDGLNLIGKKTLMALREPSLGPVFGVKGGAAGGGYAQVVPMEDINLHFTGDFHAITAANNLLCSAIDNHIYSGNTLNLDENSIKFKRCLDLNDRSLREVKVGLGAKNGIERLDGFNITAASEIMIIFCLAKDLKDLHQKLGNILIGYSKNKKPIFAKDLNIVGSLVALLKDAMNPNLVQTLENNPVIIHGGPFANIAHGCNSIIATDLSLKLADYVVTEAGFGSDLGAEKFLDIKCRLNNLKPNAIVLVTTIKTLKYNAGVLKEDMFNENADKVKDGLPNLEAHILNLKKYGVPLIVCLNKYQTDTKKEIAVVEDFCKSLNVPFSVCDSFVRGGKGAKELANQIVELCNKKSNFKPLYELEKPIKEKIAIIAEEIYHASKVNYTDEALEEIKKLTKLGFANLPICIAKTQYSLSDDPKKLGFPKNFEITVREIRLYGGAGFITVLLGDMMTMPGLPKIPNYEKIGLDANGKLKGIF